jgi:UDP-N-acetylglucosamine 1-carboxyvinyltransferase
MQKLIIDGKKILSGSINISGSKNSALPILAATILNNHTTIKNIPFVNDILTMLNLLRFIGLKYKISKKKNLVEVINSNTNINTVAPYKLVKTMRAGILVLGPLLAKYRRAKVSLPGGCAIGTRPVDLHLFALKKLGAKIKIKNGYIFASAINGLRGTRFKFPTISVGATENTILAAVQAKGVTIIDNCAVEPEIKDLINFLKKLGVNIKIKGRQITIKKIIKEKKISHKIICDRIELGTYLICGALTAKKLKLKNVDSDLVKKEIKTLKKMGVKLNVNKNFIEVFKSINIKKINIKTEPYPGFPSDLQAQIMILMTQAKGLSIIKENIFENRFMHVPELKRMGAKIEIRNNIAYISGPCYLNGAEVMATDLRASVSLVLAALIADKRTKINRIYHLDRGYQDLEKKLIKCNARIKRI